MRGRSTRRGFLAAVLAGGTAGCVGTGLVREEQRVNPAGAVPTARGQRFRTGTVGVEGPTGLIEEKWLSGFSARRLRSPALVDGRLYAADESRRVVAIDAADGGETWRTEIPTNRYSSIERGGTPTVHDGVVYVTGGGTLAALDADTGDRRWTADRFAGGSPAVGEGRIVYGTGHEVVAVTPDGRERWRFALGDNRLDHPSFHDTPTIDDGTVYVGIDDYQSSDDGLFAFDAETGEELWRTATGSSSHSTAAVHDGTVYVGASTDDDAFLLAVDADTGRERWRAPVGSSDATAPAVADGTVYVGTDRGVYALDDDDGDEQWHRRRAHRGPRRWRGRSSTIYADAPVVATNGVYLTGRRGYGGRSFLFCLSPEDGETLWRREAEQATPVPAGDVVYATRRASGVSGRAITALGTWRRR